MGNGKRTKQHNHSADRGSSTSLESLDSSGSVPPSIHDTPPAPGSVIEGESQVASLTNTPVLDLSALVSLKQASYDELKQRVTNLETQFAEFPTNNVAAGPDKFARLEEKIQEVEILKEALVLKEQQWDKKLESLDAFYQYMGIAVATLITLTGVLGTSRANVSVVSKGLGYLLSGALGLGAHQTFNHLRSQENANVLPLFQTILGKSETSQAPASRPQRHASLQ